MHYSIYMFTLRLTNVKYAFWKRTFNTCCTFFYVVKIMLPYRNVRVPEMWRQSTARGIGPLVGRTSRNRRSDMHVLAVILSITCHFFFICQYIFIRVIWSGREMCPLLMYPSIFSYILIYNENTSSGKWLTLIKTTLLPGHKRVTVVASLPTSRSRDVTANIPIIWSRNVKR